MIVIRREGKIPGRYLLSRYDFPEQHLTQNTQPHKMVKYTQKIWRLLRTNYLGKFEHFVGLALKGLRPCQISILTRKQLNTSKVLNTSVPPITES